VTVDDNRNLSLGTPKFPSATLRNPGWGETPVGQLRDLTGCRGCPVPSLI
jgi:hypothetical protein